MTTIKVLIFPCGAENALELHDALAYCVNIEPWGASSREDHGRHVFKNYVGNVPYIDDPEFLDCFNRIVSEHEIDVIFPTHDTIAQFFANHREEIACRVIMADNETAKICREKQRIHEVFADSWFVPRTYAKVEDVENFPVFLKPNIGEGGKGTCLIETAESGLHVFRTQPDSLLVEYLPGAEYTVDCFTDRHGTLRFVGARERSRINYGISVQSKSVPLVPEIEQIANEINGRLKFRGLWFFQLKIARDGSLKLMEISTRVAGTMCLYRNQGVNLPLLSVYDAMEMDIEILRNDFSIEVDRALINRFDLGIAYEAIYLDFDDTLICRGEVNTNVLLLLYQSTRKGIPVYLLTRHQENIYKSLEKARIHPSLFAEIRTLNWQDRKFHFVTKNQKAIFIDNSFEERKEMKEHVNIPVFDVDSVAALLDWKI